MSEAAACDRTASAPARAPRRVRRRRKVLFLLILCLAALVFMETGIRVMNRVRLGRWVASDPEEAAANSRLYVAHAWLGQILRPGADVTSKGRHITINSFGYRGREVSLAKPPGIVRIACIGGSTTFDVKVSDDGRAWPARLEAILRGRPGFANVEVVNAATNGYALPRTLIDLALRTIDLQPDWVVCYPGVNDLAYSDRPSDQYGRSHEAVPPPAPAPSVWTRLLGYSELYNEIDARIRYARQIRYGNWQGRPVERLDAPDDRAMRAFKRNLATLAGICQAHGARLALVTVRTAYHPRQPLDVQQRLARGDLMDHAHLSLAGHYAGYETINRLIREAAARHGLLLIDQAAELPPGEEFFADSVHFNDAGSERFAQFAAERFLNQSSAARR